MGRREGDESGEDMERGSLEGVVGDIVYILGFYFCDRRYGSDRLSILCI